MLGSWVRTPSGSRSESFNRSPPFFFPRSKLRSAHSKPRKSRSPHPFPTPCKPARVAPRPPFPAPCKPQESLPDHVSRTAANPQKPLPDPRFPHRRKPADGVFNPIPLNLRIMSCSLGPEEAAFQTVPLPFWPRRGRTSVTPCAASAEHGVWMSVPMPASKMPHSCGEAYFPVGRHIYSLMCGIFEADFSSCTLTPCSADAAHGVTEMQPLRGYARCRTHQALPSAAKGGICAFGGSAAFHA